MRAVEVRRYVSRASGTRLCRHHNGGLEREGAPDHRRLAARNRGAILVRPERHRPDDRRRADRHPAAAAHRMGRHGASRGLAVAITLVAGRSIGLGLAWVFADSLFANLGASAMTSVRAATRSSPGSARTASGPSSTKRRSATSSRHPPDRKSVAGGLFKARSGPVVHRARWSATPADARVPPLYNHRRRVGLGVGHRRFAPTDRERVAVAGRRRLERRERLRSAASASSALIDTAVIAIGMFIGTPHGDARDAHVHPPVRPDPRPWISGLVTVLVRWPPRAPAAPWPWQR